MWRVPGAGSEEVDDAVITQSKHQPGGMRRSLHTNTVAPVWSRGHPAGGTALVRMRGTRTDHAALLEQPGRSATARDTYSNRCSLNFHTSLLVKNTLEGFNESKSKSRTFKTGKKKRFSLEVFHSKMPII